MVAAALGGMAFYYAPAGERLGGLYQHIPLCTDVSETGCVITWRTYKAGQQIPPQGFAVSAANPLLAARNMVYRMLDWNSDYAYADTLSFGLQAKPLTNYILPVALNSPLAPSGIRFIAFNDMYQAYFERQGPFAIGLMVDYIAAADDQRENDLANLETGLQWKLSGYYQKDYNIFIWALLEQIDCKLSNCNLTSSTASGADGQPPVLFPNPSRGLVRLASSLKLTSLRVFDQGGKTVYETTDYHHPTGLDLSGLPAGMYLIETTDQSGVRHAQKLILTP
ncbi:MAG: T9SS C-terminal target domain-containing protein [Bacteroidetes bacterium]|nr:MAG: T9SS C-terminal target domain-containing protein [Bacteroidota bacterium]